MIFQTRLTKTDGPDYPDGQDEKKGLLQQQGGRGGQPRQQIARPQKPKGFPVQPQDFCEGQGARREFSFVKVWQNALMYSAFWDGRHNDFDNAHNATWLRIMTILPSGRRLKRRVVSCLFQIDGKYVTSELQYYEMCENHNKDYGGYILSCQVPEEIKQRPCSVMVQEGSTPNPDGTTRIPVYSTDQRSLRYKYGICVSPVFGSVDPRKLVEFIELSRLLGAEKITFYDANISNGLKALLKYYEEQGLVQSVPWLLDSSIAKRIWYHGQLVALQDCLYRNMGSVDMVAINDIDEFIIPRRHTLWVDWYNDTTAQAQYAGYSFRSTFFPPKAGRGDHFLMTVQNDHRTSQVNRVRNKVMTYPSRVFEIGIHHISKPVLARLQVLPVSETDVLLHHYRSCSSSYMQDCSNITKDDRIKRIYGTQLEELTLQALKDLNIDL